MLWGNGILMKSALGTQSTQFRGKKIAWLSFIVFDFCNTVSQTQILDQMSKRGHETYLFAMRSKRKFSIPDSNVHLILTPIRHVPLVSSTLYVFAMSLLLPFYVASKKFDYIIVEPGTSIIGLVWQPLLRLTNSRVVLDVRTTPLRFRNDLREHLHEILFRNSIIFAKKRFQGMTILTRLMKAQICYGMDVSPSFVGVWTSGVSGRLFDPRNYDGRVVREEFGMENKFIILHHGVIRKERILEGIFGTVKSIALVRDQFNDIVLFLLGGGEGESMLKELIEENHLEGHVFLHTKVDYSEVPRFIAMSDVGIVPLADSPNWRYQCPLKLLEYLAMEKVAIVTDIPAHREIIGKSKSGIYVKSIDPYEIAAAITFAHQNKDRLNDWGRHGRNIVEDRYTWEKVAQNLDEYLLSI